MGQTQMSLSIFDPTPFPPAYIPKNEELRHHWDLEENLGFYSPSSEFPHLRVVQTDNTEADYQTALILGAIQKYVEQIKICLREALHKNSKSCNRVKDNVILFIVTKCTLQEIPRNNVFEGINKPKEVVYNIKIDDLKFDLDNEYRAGRRHIMLTLRGPYKFKSWKAIKRLILHELSHTMCNHIVYRDEGNHGKDFKQCESFLKEICQQSRFKPYENYIERLIDQTTH